jgi:hypothetical protein
MANISTKANMICMELNAKISLTAIGVPRVPSSNIQHISIMKSSISCQSFVRLLQGKINWAKVLVRTAVVAALALVLPEAAWAQSNVLVNPGMETGNFTGWTTYSAETWNYNIADTNGGELSNPCTAPASCPNPDVAHSGQYSFFLFGDYQGGSQFDGMYQDIKTVTAADVFSADGWLYSYGSDYFAQNGQNLLWIEVTFRDADLNVLALYRSQVVTSNSSYVLPPGLWVDLPVTNQYDPTTFAITNTVTNLVAPPGTADARYQIVFNQVNYGGGSSFWDDFTLDFISGPVPPTLSTIDLNGLTLCTNADLTCTATSAGGTITNVQVIAKTSTLGSTVSTTVTNILSSPAVTGLGTGTANINYALTTNLIYTVTVVATDNNGNSSSSGASFNTISPSLVIEATDFNFSSGQFIDTPPNGGLFLYTNQVGVEGIDEHKNLNNTSTKASYRSGDEAVIQVANSVTFNEQKYGTNFNAVELAELCVDYTSTADWLNYTRTYGPGGSAPAGTYNVWACLGTVGTGNQSSLYQIAGDPTTQDQTTNLLGVFGTASFSENSWAGYEYVPLTDQYGNLVSASLPSGPQTLRITQIANPNFEYLMLMPVAPVLTPVLQFDYPDGLHPFEATNYLTFTLGPANGSNIASSGISLVLNGVNVTSNPGFSLTQAGGSWTANYSIQSNAIYAAVINVTNTAGLSSAFTINFDTFNVSNYQWEAVDYDFSTNNGSAWLGGLFIDNPVPTCDVTAPQLGELETNSYFAYPIGFTPGKDNIAHLGAVAQQGIDINFPNDGQSTTSEYYRADGVGTQPALDYVRPKFLAAQQQFSDPNIGPINIGYYGLGYWLNYSRHYPTNSYYVWGRIAGVTPLTGTALSIVTSGVGSSIQTSNVLGTFSDPNAAGYQVWHWIPLLDTNGNMVQVSLGGLATLKVTSGNDVNLEFFMLVPAPTQLQVTPSLLAGGQLNLSFPTESGHTYTVVYKSNLSASTWTAVGNAISGNGSVTNVTEILTGTQGYYTISVQ